MHFQSTNEKFNTIHQLTTICISAIMDTKQSNNANPVVAIKDPNDPDGVCRCNEAVGKAMASPIVKFMITSMNQLGCHVPPYSADKDNSAFFQCSPCNNKGIVGVFTPDTKSLIGSADATPGIVICSDNIKNYNLSNDHVERTIVHEMVHAYDHCRAKMDWTNCHHMACTEIRAAHLSSDCDFKTELFRGNVGKFKGQGAVCIKRRAALSISSQTQCAADAEKIVEEVFESCYNDTTPFAKKI